jgi:oxygen-independent coproporphyrinogen-3 oxidase
MAATTHFDPDLQARYDRPGPRYTSYPPAPRFSDSFGEADLRSAAQASNDEPIPRPLSLYVHVPFCASPCFYCGCNRIITRDRARGGAYLARLYREIALIAALFDRDRRVVQLHFGGGTPNFLSPAQLAETVDVLRSHFSFDRPGNVELSIELDPRHVADGDLATLADAGFNRASFGVQDFETDVQRAVNRVQSVEQTLQAIEACRRHGFRSVNLDLIYGLPLQTLSGFDRTLGTVIEARPDRLAVYGYSHLPAMFPAQRQIAVADLPTPRLKLELLQLAVTRLTEAGYRYIGMDHFALPTDDLVRAQDSGDLHRNFMGYTTCAESDLVGIGVSAISHIGASYSQNPRALPAWQAAVDEGRLPVWRGAWLDDDDCIRAGVIQELMCLGSVDIPRLEHRHAIRFEEYFSDALLRLRPLVEDGLATVTGRCVSATPPGRLLLRIIAMCFDRYQTMPS